MEKPKMQTLKGFRDFLPEEAEKRQYVIGKLRQVFELYGFQPLETPALEYASILLGKYGEEADRLVYTFEDRGGRKVGMRYDQTVPLARVIAQYPEIPKPFKRYQIQPVWRAEKPQKGRYRELVQCDADIIGPKSYTADAEILSLFASCYEALEINYKIFINSREILYSLIKPFVKNEEALYLRILQSIDKLDKKSENEVKKELTNKGLSKQQAKDILDQIKTTTIDDDKWLRYVEQIATQNFGLPSGRIEFKPTLARGLDYYTGLIFECNLKSGGLSLGGGGRYDNLIEQLGGVSTPAVGFALGFDRMVETQSMVQPKVKTKVFVSTVPDNEDFQGLNSYSFNLVKNLRERDINTELNLDTKAGLDKQLKYADKKGIPWVIMVGPEEKEKGVVKVKEMRTGKQEVLEVKKLVERLRK